jgi:hypothetical protein
VQRATPAAPRGMFFSTEIRSQALFDEQVDAAVDARLGG